MLVSQPLSSRCRLPETCARLHLQLQLFVFLMTPLMLFCVRAPSHVEFWCCSACASDEIFLIVFCWLASWHFLFACVVQTGILTFLPHSLVFIACHSMTVNFMYTRAYALDCGVMVLGGGGRFLIRLLFLTLLSCNSLC